MRGTKWRFVKEDYKKCLTKLTKMKDIIVSTYTFDDAVNVHVEQKKPSEALKLISKLPCTYKNTNYPKVLDVILNSIDRADEKYQHYINILLFLSDGQGGYPEKEVQRILEMKKAGRKILFYTIAFVADDDDDMKRMVKELGGEHFEVSSDKGPIEIFNQILGI